MVPLITFFFPDHQEYHWAAAELCDFLRDTNLSEALRSSVLRHSKCMKVKRKEKQLNE